VALEPESAGAYAGKAFVLLMLNRADEAEQEARQAFKLDSGLIAAHYMLGTVQLMQVSRNALSYSIKGNVKRNIPPSS